MYKKFFNIFRFFKIKEIKTQEHIFSFLLINTFILQIIFWLFFEKFPNLWIYSENLIEMNKLFKIGVDAGYF